MVACSHTTKSYMGRILVKLRVRTSKGKKQWRAAPLPRVDSCNNIVQPEQLLAQAAVNIRNELQHFPQLMKMCQPGARPGWGLRDETGALDGDDALEASEDAEEGWEWYEGVDTTGSDETYEPATEPETDESEAEQPAVLPRRPTAQEFAANPDRYLLQLLSRTAKKFCNAKWDPCDELADGSHAPCLRLCSKYRAYIIKNKSKNTQPYGLNNLCMPLHVPPREALRRRIAKRRCHYCENTKEGYVRIYLGVDKCGNPVKEYLHRLVLLAFGPSNEPGAYTGRGGSIEVSHECCNTWCANANHMCWATHFDNIHTNPYSAPGNQGNVDTIADDNALP